MKKINVIFAGLLMMGFMTACGGATESTDGAADSTANTTEETTPEETTPETTEEPSTDSTAADSTDTVVEKAAE